MKVEDTRPPRLTATDAGLPSIPRVALETVPGIGRIVIGATYFIAL